MSFIWPADAAQAQSGAPISFTWGTTGGGVKVGGGGIYSIPAIFLGSGGMVVGGSAPYSKDYVYPLSVGGMKVGGLASIVPNLVFFSYQIISSGGGIKVGGMAQVSRRFTPDADFPGPGSGIGVWIDDRDFPGEQQGGT